MMKQTELKHNNVVAVTKKNSRDRVACFAYSVICVCPAVDISLSCTVYVLVVVG